MTDQESLAKVRECIAEHRHAIGHTERMMRRYILDPFDIKRGAADCTNCLPARS
jgi:hypothetical protein